MTSNKQYTQYAKLEADFLVPYPFSPTVSPECYFIPVDAAASELALHTLLPVHDLVPLQATGNGDCLFNSVSICLSGSEFQSDELRYRAAVQMGAAASQYRFAKYDELALVSPSYNAAMVDCAVKGKWSCAWTLQALANAISVPIQTHYPRMNGPRDKTVNILNKTFYPMAPNSANRVPMQIMWSKLSSSNNAGHTWTPNHFVPLIHREKVIGADGKLCSDGKQSTDKDKDSCSHEPLYPAESVISPDAESEASDITHPCSVNNTDQPKSPQHVSTSPSCQSPESIWSNSSQGAIFSHSDCQLTPQSSPWPAPLSPLSSKSSPVADDRSSSSPVHWSDPVACGGHALTNSKHLSREELIDVFTNPSEVPLPNIPEGRKENLWFAVDNSENVNRRRTGMKSSFADDCGAWIGGPSPITRLIQRQDAWQTVILQNGKYGQKVRVAGGTRFVPLDQQPAETEVFKLHQSYNSLKADPTYSRRISWMEQSPNAVAVIEYRGKFPGPQRHGNAKNKHDAYVRTLPTVLQKIKEKGATTKPREVYETLNKIATSENLRPADLHQVQNAVYNAKRKMRQEQGVSGVGRNLADNMQQVHNMVQDHPYVQNVIHSKSHVPSIILYTEKQIEDLRRFCCSAPLATSTVISVDKTYNLGQLHVTPMVFKHLGLIRPTTRANPIFLGPVLIHGNSDVRTYSLFFHVIATELDLEKQPGQPVIGSDDEKAIRKAIRMSFAQSKRIICERHLKKNAIDHLSNKVGAHDSLRKTIVGSMFGNTGLASSASLPIFEERLSYVESLIAERVPAFDTYFRERLLPIISENVDTVLSTSGIEHGWTNNNSESMNHVLKMKVDWKPQMLPQLINSLHDIVQGHYTDVERAIIGRGEFRLSDGFEHFYIAPSIWCAQTIELRQRHLMKFQKAKKLQLKKKFCVSSDGELHVLMSPAGGKKPGQFKRKRNAKTTSGKKPKT